MDAKEAKEKASEAIKAGKEKLGEAFSQENIEAGKEKLKAGTAEVKKRISLLPFRAMAEKKIPQATREKFPILNRLIPFTNQIACGMAVVLVVVFVACSSKGSSSGLGGSANSASDFSFDLTEDGKGIKITKYTGNAVKVVVPSKIEGLPVVEIGDNAFHGRRERDGTLINTDKIVSVYVPDSVTKIGEWSFSYCRSLTEVRLSDNITSIPNSAFYHSAIRKINLPKNLKEIGPIAFVDCEALTDLEIPSNIKAIRFLDFIGEEDPNNGAFQGCGKLPIKTRQTIQGWGYKSGF